MKHWKNEYKIGGKTFTVNEELPGDDQVPPGDPFSKHWSRVEESDCGDAAFIRFPTEEAYEDTRQRAIA